MTVVPPVLVRRRAEGPSTRCTHGGVVPPVGDLRVQTPLAEHEPVARAGVVHARLRPRRTHRRTAERVPSCLDGIESRTDSGGPCSSTGSASRTALRRAPPDCASSWLHLRPTAGGSATRPTCRQARCARGTKRLGRHPRSRADPIVTGTARASQRRRLNSSRFRSCLCLQIRVCLHLGAMVLGHGIAILVVCLGITRRGHNTRVWTARNCPTGCACRGGVCWVCSASERWREHDCFWRGHGCGFGLRAARGCGVGCDRVTEVVGKVGVVVRGEERCCGRG